MRARRCLAILGMVLFSSIIVTAVDAREIRPQVAAGQLHTLGLRSDGTVVAVGHNGLGQCNVSTWTGIVQVAAGSYHTVGLKANGTVVAVGDNYYGQCAVGISSWSGIVHVAAGSNHTVGLKADGTVVAMGDNTLNQCAVSTWTG